MSGSFVRILSCWLIFAGVALSQSSDPIRLTLEPGHGLELRASWEPLTDTVYRFETQYPWLAELQPAKVTASYGAEAFRPLLPEEPVQVGDTWKVDTEALVALLKQIHPGATSSLHHGDGGKSGISAPGAWACLRAAGERHAEIVLRAHVDFLLRGDGTFGESSWMTPAQFEGRLVIDRVAGRAIAFSLALPDSSANVDINVGTGRGVSADIGRIPNLELRGALETEDTTYEHEIGIEEARSALQKKFYPLADLTWLELPDALAESRRTDRPMHIVVLFGSLTDESC
ncbi:MAG: hypothetical protein RL885_28340 [Planctomycetota bacterium]